MHGDLSWRPVKTASLPVKCESDKVGRRKVKRVIPIEVTMSIAHRAYHAPNLSKKIRGRKLYPFPSFDKCDSLLFFPTTFSSMMNSVDLPSLLKLFRQRTDKNCTFHTCGRKMDLDAYMKFFEIMNEMHPDSVTCVHQTKVIENQIHAVLYFKYTENKLIRAAVEKTLPDVAFLGACPTPRPDFPSFAAFLANKTDEERFKLTALLSSSNDMVIYGQSTMILTFGDMNKKIIKFEAKWECTSFRAVE